MYLIIISALSLRCLNCIVHTLLRYASTLQHIWEEVRGSRAELWGPNSKGQINGRRQLWEWKLWTPLKPKWFSASSHWMTHVTAKYSCEILLQDYHPRTSHLRIYSQSSNLDHRYNQRLRHICLILFWGSSLGVVDESSIQTRDNLSKVRILVLGEPDCLGCSIINALSFPSSN